MTSGPSRKEKSKRFVMEALLGFMSAVSVGRGLRCAPIQNGQCPKVQYAPVCEALGSQA